MRRFWPIAAGLAFALSAPPFQWWPCALMGFGLVYVHLRDRRWTQRLVDGWSVGMVSLLITLAWTRQFSLPGWIVLAACEAILFGCAAALVPRQTHLRIIAFPATFFLAEWIRLHWPFGGIPVGGFVVGQVDGPLASAAAVVGECGLVALVAIGGAVVGELLIGNMRTRSSAVALTTAVLIIVVWGANIHTTSAGVIEVATVQAGGKQALPRKQQRPNKVFDDHILETANVSSTVDLIVWPEDVIQVDRAIEQSTAGDAMAELASTHQAIVIAGVVQTLPQKRFRNMAVSWDANGNITSSYEKVHRVPFGEYVPFRSLVQRFVDLAEVPSDAGVGTKPPVITIGSNHAAIAVSYEGLFTRHVRAGVRNGGQIVLVPTNAASYTSTTVANMQLAALRLRAIETGRWAVQAAPTGYSAIVDEDGDVLARSQIGPSAVLQHHVTLKTGDTPYVRWGDLPLLAASALVLTLMVVKMRSPNTSSNSDLNRLPRFVRRERA